MSESLANDIAWLEANAESALADDFFDEPTTSADSAEKQFSDGNELPEGNGELDAESANHDDANELGESSAEKPAKKYTGPSGGFFSEETSYVCEECEQNFEESWLKKNFDCNVCESCRDKDGKHGLVTKTDACSEYLMRDEDFFRREPPLRFIAKKNPHNAGWGTMKLFLRCQVEDRALEVWGSEEALEAELEKREDKKVQSKKRTFDKMIKELRMNARSSLKLPARASHVHDFDEEKHNAKKDVYTKKCKTCDHVSEYEKM